MQFNVNINQVKALEWGLNSSQAILFSFLYEVPSWANTLKTEDGIFYVLSKGKITEELPILTDKLDTAYRYLKQLAAKGVIDYSHTPTRTLVRLTDKGKTWNRKVDGSEKYPSHTGDDGSEKNPSTSEKNPSQGRKKIRAGSEKNPTNHETIDPVTNNPETIDQSSALSGFALAWQTYPKRSGANPKAKAESCWNARIKEGVTPEAMLAGVARYAAYCAAKGNVGSEFVMQASRFFGTERAYENDWSVSAPPTRGGNRRPSSLGTASRDYHGSLQGLQEDGTHAY